MEAVVCYDFNESAIEDVPRPEPEAGEVLVKVNRVQLSVTECNVYRGKAMRHHDEVAAAVEDGGALLFGHEFCGEIAELGPSAEGFEVGDRVFAPGKISCGECPYCRAEYRHLCRDTVGLGYERPGALAEYFTIPTEPLEKLPDGVSNAEGAALQPLASAMLCAHDADIETGDVVTTIGTGIMGYQCGQLALAMGASRVFAVDVVPEKLELAEKRGMIPIDARTQDPVEEIRDATDGIGSDVVFEAVGGDQHSITDGSDPIAQAFEIARVGGTLLQIGHLFGDLSFNGSAMRSKKLTYRHPRMGSLRTGPNGETGKLAAELVASGRVSISEYVTHELDGLSSFEEAVSLTLDNEEGLGPAQMVVSE